MKKLIYITATVFFAIIFSCTKSDISPISSVELKVGDTHLNVVLFDEVLNAATKPIHVKFFDTSYATDGSKAIIKSNLVFGLAEIQSGEIIEPGSDFFTRDDEVAWAYCMNDGTVMTGFFLNYFVTPALLSDKPALAAFKIWFEKIVVEWMNANNLAPKVKNNKPGQYWKKVIGSFS